MGWKFWGIVVAYVVMTAALFTLCMALVVPLVKQLPSLVGQAAAEAQTAYEKEKATQGSKP